MKLYWLGALALGVALFGACGPTSNNEQLCESQNGYCTSASSCGAELPFGCGSSGQVCCQNGSSPTGTAPVSTGSTTPAADAGGTTTPAVDAGGTAPAKDAGGTTTPVDSGTATPAKDAATTG